MTSNLDGFAGPSLALILAKNDSGENAI